MSKYISYDDLDYKNYKVIDKSQEFLDGVVYMAERIEEAPSIEIIFCKDCRWHTSDDECTHPHWDISQMLYPKAMEYDFCSYGER